MFTIAIVADGVDEPAERFNVTLSNATSAVIESPGSAVVAIDDAAAIPTASTWALLALIAMLAVIGRMRI
jgi:hypothetical protein